MEQSEGAGWGGRTVRKAGITGGAGEPAGRGFNSDASAGHLPGKIYSLRATLATPQDAHQYLAGEWCCESGGSVWWVCMGPECLLF